MLLENKGRGKVNALKICWKSMRMTFLMQKYKLLRDDSIYSIFYLGKGSLAKSLWGYSTTLNHQFMKPKVEDNIGR